jgi:hypothetical protein
MLWTRPSAFFLPRGRGLRFAKRPAVNFHVNSHANFHALRLKQLSLQCGVWLRNSNPTASPEHAMPGNPLAAWAGRQGVTDSARSSPQTHRFRNPTVGRHAPARNFFHLTIDWIPGHCALFYPCQRSTNSQHLNSWAALVSIHESRPGKAGRKLLLLKFCCTKCCAKNAALSD